MTLEEARPLPPGKASRPRASRVVVLLACALAACAPARPAAAVPLFSSDGSCQGCHSAPPQLNAAGMRFLENGYRLPDSAVAIPAHARSLPVSVAGLVDYGETRSGGAITSRKGDLRSVDLRSLGPLSDRLAFDLAATLDPDSHLLAARTAYVQLDDAVRAAGVNVRVGAFEGDAPYLSDDRRPTVAEYLSPIDLEAHGIEINGEAAAWTYGAGLVNSRRIAHLRVGSHPLNRLEDTYYWVYRDLFGQRIGARMLFDRQDSNLRTLAWLQHLQAQGSALLEMGRLQLIPAYTFERFDDRPRAGNHARQQFGLLQAIAPFGREGRWVLTARAEHEYKTKTDFTPEQDRSLEVLDFAFYSSHHLREALECARSGDNVGGPPQTNVNLSLYVSY